VVAQTDEVLAFRHTCPFWPVHIVVVSKQHVPSLIDLRATDEALLHKVLAVRQRSTVSAHPAVGLPGTAIRFLGEVWVNERG
jgi:diadenosine tetraphosphate (Ap4A) HIT family hydrolase